MVLLHGTLLHGRLEVSVLEAVELWEPTERSARERAARAVLCNSVLNPYVTVSLEHLPRPSKRILKTACAHATDRPAWNDTQVVDVATNVSYVVVHVKSSSFPDQSDSAWRPRKSLGFVRISTEDVKYGVNAWFPLGGLRPHAIHNPDAKNRGSIRLKITYKPIDSIMFFGQPSVPGTYFNAVENCHVQLFQDAHCPAGAVLDIPGSSDAIYAKGPPPRVSQTAIRAGPVPAALGPLNPNPVPVNYARNRHRSTNYFEEIYHTILNARKLVYIAGWSVDTTLELLRKKPNQEASFYTSQNPKPLSLGDLLKRKAAQGVRVLLLVWDEVLSTNKPLLRLSGFMNTRDEVTREFFRNSKVRAAVVPRIGRAGQLLKAPIVPCLFTFHEKLVVADIPAFDPKKPGDRQLTGFIGGLDLTYGRWDTPEHSLFRTLNAEHAKDFHNACFDVGKPVGPREPWHDVAAMITGPVVRDLVTCFEERWRRQGLGPNQLVDLDGANSNIVDGSFEHSSERWTVQVFRSIDERSALFDRESAKKLDTKKGRLIDRSIHHAYVHYTRAAQRFIYIEQQYFVGSSNQWLANGHGDATNLIPHEIALKVANGILSGSFFRVYVIIPMFPEGLASDAAVQKILLYQLRTFEMMMRKIADAIDEAGLEDAHPLDFLCFFCLGNREIDGPAPKPAGANESSSSSDGDFETFKMRPRSDSFTTTASTDSSAAGKEQGSRSRLSSNLARRLSSRRRRPRTADEEQLNVSRRHPIYQHAKLFISDDEVVVTGSSNLNERSLSGVRDSEMAISAFQPEHTWSADPYEADKAPRGEVARFRRRLWAEHALGHHATHFPPELEDPGSIECMHEMQRIAQRNWADYTSESVVELQSHLLPYPYLVDSKGNVTAKVRDFPDTRGSVMGSQSAMIPDLLAS